MSNSKRFLHVFALIENYLRELTPKDRRINFYERVDTVGRAKPAVRRFDRDLKEFADLRNAIIHESSDGHVIAEPNERAVQDLERIAELILKPPVVIPLFQTEVVTLAPAAPIAVAVRTMFERSISQLPITNAANNREFVALLTTNTVARWLGAGLGGGDAKLESTTIAEVLRFTEDADNHCFLARDATLFEAVACFQQHETEGRRLDAVLITTNGKSTERIIGTMTIADLPRALKAIGGEGR
jgi:CBS domain-containing protein